MATSTSSTTTQQLCFQTQGTQVCYVYIPNGTASNSLVTTGPIGSFLGGLANQFGPTVGALAGSAFNNAALGQQIGTTLGQAGSQLLPLLPI